MHPIGRLIFTLLLTITIWQVPVIAATPDVADTAVTADASDALHAYINRPDASYSWKVRHRFRMGQSDCVELTLVSQTWKDIVWKHRMFVVMPDNAQKATNAMLVIEGGRWHEADDKPLPDNQFKPPAKAVLFASLAQQMQTPLVIVLNVPQQPVFGGKREDAIIAYTFDKFLRTGENDWPLLLPMVKSAVRAMDATQAFLKEDRGVNVERFIVTGASKRGWTTWLTAASDSRVMALVPMVIDMLNMNEQLPHQKAAWGEYSSNIHDYTNISLADRLKTPTGQKLVQIVDPYAYRDRITQPKLLLLGTNDAFWTLDALNLYWDGLSGDKYISYVPNAGHNLRMDFRRIFGGILSLHQDVTGKQAMPKLQWQYEKTDLGFTLTVEPGEKGEKGNPVSRVIYWSATATTHDFRKAKWTPRELNAEDDGKYVTQIARTAQGVNAGYVEVVYNRPMLPLSLCTTIRIVDQTNKQAAKDSAAKTSPAKTSPAQTVAQ